MQEFEGRWQATSRGWMWSIDNPSEDLVHIQDIAAGLSRNCRYAGQLDEEVGFYSVAEHSVIMTSWAIQNGIVKTRSEGLFYLLHDGSEAFLGDMPTPIKALIPEFKEIEARFDKVILSAFGITEDMAKAMKADLKRIDTRVRLDERSAIILEPALSAGREALWREDPSMEPLNIKPDLLDPTPARKAFLSAFAWILENLPDDIGRTRAIEDAEDYLKSRDVIAGIKDYAVDPVPELAL